MFDAFSLDFTVRTRITHRHYAFELSLGDGRLTLYALCDPGDRDAPGALVPSEDRSETMRFLQNVARELELPVPRSLDVRATPADIGLHFRGRDQDGKEREWLSYRIRIGARSEAYFRVCPELGVAHLDEKPPVDRASLFTALCKTLVEPESAVDRSAEHALPPEFDWLQDNVPLLYDVTPQPIAIKPPHVKWLGSHLVAIDASGRRVVQIEPERVDLFEARKIHDIRRVTEHCLQVNFEDSSGDRLALIDLHDRDIEYIDEPIAPDLSWSNGLVFEDVDDGLSIHSRHGSVTYKRIGQAWRAVPPRYVLARTNAYYLLDVLERRGWELAPAGRWWAFELNAGVSRAAFATMTGRLFTAAVDRRFIDASLPARSRPLAVEEFWAGVDVDFVTVAGIHTELSVTRLAQRYGIDADALADKLEERLAQFMALYLPDEWTPAAVRAARFDLAPAWAVALERGINPHTVQAAAERLAFEALKQRLEDDSFVDMLVRGGRPIGPQDLNEFERCVSTASDLFLATAEPNTKSERMATEVQLYVRQASDSLRLLAERSVDVEPDKWDTVRSRMQRFGLLARNNAPPIIGQHELLSLAREVEALA